MKNCKVIAITNQKGGVGKTTTTANLGVALVDMGKRVLVIDTDPQASLTMSLGFRDTDNLNCTLTSVFRTIVEDYEMNPKFEVLKNEEGIDVMPADIELCGIEIMLVNEMSREKVLKTYVDSVRDKYDYILIDCMPSLGMLTFNALCAADSVIIPSQPEFLSAKGLDQLVKTIGRIKRRLNPDLKIDGILLTMVDYRTTFARDVSEMMRQQYDKYTKVFNTAIPRSIRAAETSAEGVSIFKHDPKGKIADAYRLFAKEVDSIAKEQIRRKNRAESVR
ncbi:MAG: AAA family ATPase [Clostridia bacterium]|nr:AAA family ATPase [Clostridia bacterium]